MPVVVLAVVITESMCLITSQPLMAQPFMLVPTLLALKMLFGQIRCKVILLWARMLWAVWK